MKKFFSSVFIVIIYFITMFDCNAQSGVITTFAGTGVSGFAGDGSAATLAQITNTIGITIDTFGNVFFAANNRLRKINTAGVISTIAGTGAFGFSGDGGMATMAAFNSIYGIDVDLAENILLADLNNDRIRKISSTRMMSTIAGNGIFGFAGDGSAATIAELNYPYAVKSDNSGNIIIADYWNNRIRKVNNIGIISTIAGTSTSGSSGDGGAATAAQLSQPTSVAIDATGNIYIADFGNNKVRKINGAGIISTFAGNGSAGYTGDGGAATAAELNSPIAVTVDIAGNVYIADNSNNCIRRVSTTGVISTIAGNGGSGSSGDGGTATNAQLSSPMGVTVDMVGNVFVSDNSNNRIRKISGISGTTSLCIGTNSTLTDVITGGSWTSSNSSIATVGATTGIVTGILSGSTNITYSIGTKMSTVQITVLPMPIVGTIFGNSSLCVATNDTLLDTTFTGTRIWTSLHTSIATVDTNGVVHGVSGGIDTIKFSVSNLGCSSYTIKPITVIPLPISGAITGFSGVCVGSTITLNDPISGGLWSANNSHATISSSGVITGVTFGLDTIKYTVTNACGMSVATKNITVYTTSAGTITGSDSICVTFSYPFHDSVTGGIWTCIGGVADITTGGLVTGVNRGSGMVHYTITNMCGTFDATYPITVVSVSGGTITGADTICVGNNTTLIDTTSGGNWNSTSTMVSVSSTGIVTGVAAGFCTVTYTVTNLCGSASSVHAMTILPTADLWCTLGNRTITNVISGLNVFPNPSQGEFTINVSSIKNEKVVIVITDLLGKKIEEFTNNTNTKFLVNTPLNTGIYFIKATTENEQYFEKIVVY